MKQHGHLHPRGNFIKRLVIFLLSIGVLLQPLGVSAYLDSTATLGLSEFSHHDLGWHKGSFQAESSYTNSEINRALDMMQSDPDFTWTHEHGVYLYAYLKSYPERFDELKERILEGRFEVGAGYSSPYTGFVTAETMARQFLYGKKWVEDLIPGYTADVYYNTDVPGFSAQMPQILKKSGVNFLYASRSWNFPDAKNNEFRLWNAPDGSGINTFFMHHYGDNVWDGTLDSNAYIERMIAEADGDMEEKNLGKLLPVVRGTDCLMPADFSQRIASWNAYAEENNLPKMEYITLQNALKQAFTEQADLSADALYGEWPNKWFYENAASDYRTFLDQREAERYLRAAETLGVIRASVEGSFVNYPTAQLEEIWRKVDFACHGYAPAGVIEDFRRIYGEAYEAAKALYEEQLQWLAAQIGADSGKGDAAFSVYNGLSFQRDDLVCMPVPENAPATFRLFDDAGNEIPYQITADGELLFKASGVPSFGYRTYYLKAGSPAGYTQGPSVGTAWTEDFSNDYYTVTPALGGLEQIVDKENGAKPLFDTQKFKIAELLDFQYDGMGAGEQLYMWQPHDPVSITAYEISGWTCVETGPVRTVFEMTADTARGPVALRVSLYQTLKRIDFDLDLEDMDETAARQLRLMFPIRTDSLFDQQGNVVQEGVKVSYEVPFGSVDIGDEVVSDFSSFNDNSADPNDTNDSKNKSMRPREVQNWIQAADDTFQVTFSSYGLGWDYQDATENPVKSPVLQPVLLSSSEACHGSYGHWTQPGALSYHFSMTSGKPGYDGDLQAIAANHPLEAVEVVPDGGSLPETYCGMAVDAEHFIVTALKKAEDDMENIVVRGYESRGEALQSVQLTFPSGVKSAAGCNIIERDTGPELAVDNTTVTLPTGKWSIDTAKIRLEGIADMPSAPINLLAAGQPDSGVTLRWDSREEAERYSIEVSEDGETWEKLAETSGTRYHTRLAYGAYQFRVQALRDGKASQYSLPAGLSVTAVVQGVTATASSVFDKQVGDLAADGSGLSDNTPAAFHDNDQNGQTMWLSADNPSGEVWLEFDLGRVCELDKMYVWNYNQSHPDHPTLSNAGLKYVNILYSEDGISWTKYENSQAEDNGMYLFAPADGRERLQATNLADGNAPLDLGGIKARKIRFEIPNERGVGNYGWYIEDSRNNYGISEVMFTEREKALRDDPCDLLNLTVAGGVMDQAFAAQVTDYTATLPMAQQTLRVQAVPYDAEAMVYVGGQIAEQNVEIPLEGRESIAVLVLSPDRAQCKTYTIRLKRDNVIQAVKATAGSVDTPAQDAANAINGSGMLMRGTDLSLAVHDNQVNAFSMWNTSASCAVEDAWIKIDLGAVYPLDEMWIWNFNQSFSGCEKRGMKRVYIEYSQDDAVYIRLDNPDQTVERGIYEFQMADQSENLPPTNLANGKGPVQFGGARARYVRISAAGGIGVGNFGGYTGSESSYGLSELRFTTLPDAYTPGDQKSLEDLMALQKQAATWQQADFAEEGWESFAGIRALAAQLTEETDPADIDAMWHLLDGAMQALTDQTLSASKAAAEKTLEGLQAANETTAESILQAVQGAVNGGVEVSWEKAFTLVPATIETEGQITGSLLLRLENAQALVEVNLVIPRLPDKDTEAVLAAEAAAREALAGLTATNDVTAQQILAAVEGAVDTDTVSVAWKDAFRLTPATGQTTGSITGSLVLRAGKAEAEVEVYLEIPPLAQPIVLGDMDKDGEVTIADVMEACKVMARESVGTDPTGDEIQRGDLDGDGEVTIADVMEICKILARRG